jgi:hypothetical protein
MEGCPPYDVTAQTYFARATTALGVNWWICTSYLYKTSATKQCVGRRRPAVKNALNTTISTSDSGISSAPGTRPTPFLKYPNCCMSCTRTEEILETPNSTVWPGCNSTTAKSLKVPSDDDSPNDVFAADEEEVNIATYRRRRRTVCLTRARSLMKRSKKGRRASERFQNARVLWRTER